MKVVKFVVGLAIGALCLWLAFRGVADTDKATGVDWHDILGVIQATSWWGYASFIALFVVQSLIRSERWRIQVRGLTGKAPPGLRESVAINAVAGAAVFLLPFRLGEFVRPNLLAQRGIMRHSAGLAATAIERALDGLVTTGFFGIVLLVAQLRGISLPTWVSVGGWISLGVFGGALLFFVVAFRWRAAMEAMIGRILSVVHGPFALRVASIVRGFLDGLACFRSVRDVLGYLALTVIFWLVNAGSIGLVMIAMGITPDPLAPFLCQSFLVVGMMVPAPPGNVGNFHAMARLSLTVFQVALAPAVAFALILHALNVTSVVLVAVAAFLSGDVSLERVRQAAHRDPSA